MVVPDVDLLATGVIAPLETDDPRYYTTKLQLYRHGLRVADEATWRTWNRFRWVELWQAVALQLRLDPQLIAWRSLGVRVAHTFTISQLFGQRIRQAEQHIRHECLPAIAIAEESRRTRVQLWDFATWCDEVAIPCAPEMPRTDPRSLIVATSTRSGRRRVVAPGNFLRQADLIPEMLPFSAATLWRKVRAGDFPAPIKLSTAITAWRRTDVEAWLEKHAAPQPLQSKRASRK